jgi:hypothetical protein
MILTGLADGAGDAEATAVETGVGLAARVEAAEGRVWGPCVAAGRCAGWLQAAATSAHAANDTAERTFRMAAKFLGLPPLSAAASGHGPCVETFA